MSKITDTDILKTIYQENLPEFLRFVASVQSEKITHKNLEKWFVDSQGNQYSRFPKSMALPIERMGHLKGYYTFMAGGISGAELAKITSTMDKVLSEGIGKPETASQMGALVHVLKERQEMVFHTELIYNILAIQAVRHDEEPDIFNEGIHLEKVIQFKEEVKNKNSYFFFHQTQLQSPIDLLRISREAWETLWHVSEANQASLQEILDLIQSGKKYIKPKKILMNS